MLVDLLGQYKPSGWTTIGQQWRSLLAFQHETGHAGRLLSQATWSAFVSWREQRHAADQAAHPERKRHDGSSIAKSLSTVLSAHTKFNGVTPDAVGESTAKGAKSLSALHKAWKTKSSKRAGGESLAFDAAATDAAITGGLHSDAAPWLRTSALMICLAVESASRCDDLLKINVAATLRRLADGGDGITLAHPDGSMFHADENFNASQTVWQACIGDDSKGVAGKHRGTHAWKDMGLRHEGVGLALFAEWAAREGAFDRLNSNPEAQIFFPGRFLKRSSQDVPRGADSRGWATHFHFDSTRDMGSSKDTWMTDVFAPLLISSGLLDPVLMRTHSGARMAGASFHGARRASSGRGQGANHGDKLPLQRLLMHMNPETQDAYVVINDKARAGVLAPSAVNLGGGITLAPPSGLLGENARALSRAGQFVRSAMEATAFRAKHGVPAAKMGTAGTYARSPHGPCFVISHVHGFPCLVLDLTSRSTEVVQSHHLSAWPPVASPPDTVAVPEGADTFPSSVAHGPAACGGTEQAGDCSPAWQCTADTSSVATPFTEAFEWHWVDTAWGAGSLVKYGALLGGSQCDFFANDRHLGVIESIWHSPAGPIEDAWQRRIRFEDGDCADFSVRELEAAVARAIVTRASPALDGTSQAAQQGGALLWRAVTTGTSWQGWAYAQTTPRTRRVRSGSMARALARSADLGDEEAGPPWVGTWRLRRFQRDEAHAPAWAPCIVRAVLPQTLDMLVVCPFTESAGLIKTHESAPWPREEGGAAEEDLWDVQKWREAGGKTRVGQAV
jgi:hypothetical protein